MSHLLLVEDDESLREVMEFNLKDAGYLVTTASNGHEGLEAFDREHIDVVITDLRMPGMDGFELLDELKKRDEFVTVLVLTAYGTTDRAIEAMRRGAFHYVEKPANITTMLMMIDRALQMRALRVNDRAGSPEKPVIISASPAMNNVLRIVDKIATSDATILIRGESGTGKELVARAIHDRSDRSRKRFIAVNCAAIPSDLLESVLFGHEKGSFTGATKTAPGKFVAAQGGTVFLDEIGEMSPLLQSKLLRVLQSGEIDVVGADEPSLVDVRILAATHRDLEEMVADGRFREDLYYRLNVVPIEIPALRDRPEDIPVLFRHFARKHGASDLKVDREVDEALTLYHWPGNIRELENVVNRMLLLADEPRLSLKDIPAAMKTGSTSTSELPFKLPEGGFDLVEHEKQLILAAIAKCGGNRSAAARYLLIPRHVLLYRLEKYEIQ